MLAIFKIAKQLPAWAAGGFGLMASIHPDTAQSNLAGWAEKFGLGDLSHVLTPRVDGYVLWACAIFFVVWLFRKRLANFLLVIAGKTSNSKIIPDALSKFPALWVIPIIAVGLGAYIVFAPSYIWFHPKIPWQEQIKIAAQCEKESIKASTAAFGRDRGREIARYYGACLVEKGFVRVDASKIRSGQ